MGRKRRGWGAIPQSYRIFAILRLKIVTEALTYLNQESILQPLLKTEISAGKGKEACSP